MRQTRASLRTAVLFVLTLLVIGSVGMSSVFAQEEVASSLRRYRSQEVSSGYYEAYEVKPSRPPVVDSTGTGPGLFSYSPAAAQVRIRKRLRDSHQGLRFYGSLLCVTCHSDQAKSSHTARENISCRQCHGGEPISSISQFYSPMNPIRRHAYVCAKCHEGASVSFGSFMVHPPDPGSPEARLQFPLMYYTYWFMFFLLVGTLGFFIPHSVLAGFRELLVTLRKRRHHG